MGASIGVITALPIALSATMMSTAVSPETDFNKFAGKLTTGITFGQAKNTNEEIKEVVTLVDIAKNADDSDFQAALKTAFGDAQVTGQITPLKADTKAFKTLENVLNSKIVAHSLKTLLDTLGVPKTVDFTKVPQTKAFEKPLVTDKIKQDRLIVALGNTYPNQSTDKIRVFLSAIGVFPPLTQTP